MNWKLSLAQRIRAGAALVVVFLLIITTNLIDKHHFRIVKDNLATVYEDRLLAKNYLYRISRYIQQKKEIIQNPDEDLWKLNTEVNDSIDVLIQKFDSTRLTEKESLLFSSLQKNIQALEKFESSFPINETITPEAPIKSNGELYFQAVFEDLDALFKIQLEEGSRVIERSNQTIKSSDLIAKLEIGALIIIGILIQLLIFLKPIK